jgi:hypothetical protein
MERQFDFLDQWPRWGRENFEKFERVASLGAKLWGNAEHMKRQLELPCPEIPAGARIEDLLLLEQRARMMISGRHASLPNPIVVAGGKQFNFAEACYEIVRRAIAALGN